MGYLEIISSLFGGLPEMVGAYKQVKELRKGQKGTKNLLQAELELNLVLLLDDYLKGGVDALKIIETLEISVVKNAMDENFDFSELTKKKLASKHIPQDAYLLKLEGYNAEKLFLKIYIKIQELKRIKTLYTTINPEKLRLNVRLKNLLKLLLITTRLLHLEQK